MLELLLIALAVVGSTASAQQVVQPRAGMLVTTEWLAAHLEDNNLIVLCVADDEQFYSSGHIPGARLLRLSQIVMTRDSTPNQLPGPDRLRKVFADVGVSNDSRIILYGERSGVVAARAYFTLDYLGLADRAALLDGGIEKWRAEGRPQSTETPRITAGKLQIHLRPEIVVDSAQVAGHAQASLNSDKVVLIDARPPLEYSGEKLSEDVKDAGHIPGAKHLYWHDLLRSEDIPELRPASELLDRFQAAGAVPGKEIITYCRTGMQSSLDYFIAKYLGYSVRMYVGSFYKWSHSDRAVETSLSVH